MQNDVRQKVKDGSKRFVKEVQTKEVKNPRGGGRKIKKKTNSDSEPDLYIESRIQTNNNSTTLTVLQSRLR